MKKIRLCLCLILAILLIAQAGVMSVSAAGDTTPITVSVAFHQDGVQQMLDLMNAERQTRGNNLLAYDTNLESIAKQRAAEVAVRCYGKGDGQTPHYHPNGTLVSGHGENLAYNIGYSSDNVNTLFAAWLASIDHSPNLVEREYGAVGMACVEMNGHCYWAQVYGDLSSAGTPGAGSGSAAMTVSVSNDAITRTTNPLDVLPASEELKVGDTIDMPVSSKVDNVVYKIQGHSPNFQGTVTPMFPNETVTGSEPVTWTSDNTDVATVDGNGKITGVHEGTANITAKLGGGAVTKTVQVTVNEVNSFNGATVTPANTSYDCNKEQPAVTVTLNGAVVPEGSYTVTNNLKDKDTMTITVTPKDGSGYSGSKSIDVTIKHTYDRTKGQETTKATCEKDGVMIYPCTNPECKATESEKIPATGHTPGTDATCVDPQKCTVCGKTLHAALGHQDKDKDGVCDRCKQKITSGSNPSNNDSDKEKKGDANSDTGDTSKNDETAMHLFLGGAVVCALCLLWRAARRKREMTDSVR